MNQISPITEEYYRKRLKEFIAERHPRLAGNKSLLRMRSRMAFQLYQKCIEEGLSILTATTRADAVLFEGLIFSRYDTLRCILSTEYPKMPEVQQRALAMHFEEHFEDIFNKYNLDDELVSRSEYNHLIADLIRAIEDYFIRNNFSVRFTNRRHKKE